MRGVKEESAFYPYTVDYLSHCKVGSDTALPDPDNYALKGLGALFVAFLYSVGHLYCGTGLEWNNIRIGFGLNQPTEILAQLNLPLDFYSIYHLPFLF